ncbi:response regulator [Primorskyibacter sp. S187A]|uniref:response regulator n=1 Tax=Primorskyibacter sp. S187A TaxID=3415130 RepID=UPI003C7A6B71
MSDLYEPHDLQREMHRSQPPDVPIAHVSDVKQMLTQPGLSSLLLEDNEMNAFLLQEYLGLMDLPEAHWVRCIAEAIDLSDEIVNGTYDVLFFDLMLPDGESFALARHLSEHCRIPLIAYTACSQPEDYHRMASSGFQDFLPKPLSFCHFKNRVTALL